MLQSLHISLRNHADIPPLALRNAARRIVDVVINRQRSAAVSKRHSKPSGLRDKSAHLREIYAQGKFPTKEACAMNAGHKLGLSPDTARRALQNQPKPKAKKQVRVPA